MTKAKTPPCKLTRRSDIIAFFWVCWLTYFCTYLGRLNFSASMAEIISAEGFTKSQLGMVGSGLFFAYGIGQLISGFLGDVLNAKWLVLFGISASSLLNFLMGFSSSPDIMVLLWSLNGLMQSLVWSPMVKIISDRSTHDQCVKHCVNLATTTPAGTLCAFLLSSVVIYLSGWRMVFFVSGGFMLAVSLLWCFGLSWLQRQADRQGVTEKTVVPLDSSSGSSNGSKKGSAGKLFLSSGLILIAMAALLHGILKDGVVTWTPTYLTEQFQIDTVFSIAITMVIPVINLAGVYLANFLNRNVFRSEVSTAAFFFGITAAALIVLIFLGSYSMVLSLVMLSITSTSMLAINTLVVNLVPLRFQKFGKVSTVTGILNSITYVGSAISIYGIGVLSENFGWIATQYAWLLIAALGAAACLFVKRRWDRFQQRADMQPDAEKASPTVVSEMP